MSMFTKALRRAEVFLEQVDESVAQASRRLVVEGATAGDLSEPSSEDEGARARGRARAIPRAEPASVSSSAEPAAVVQRSDVRGEPGASFLVEDLSGDAEAAEGDDWGGGALDIADGWGGGEIAEETHVEGDGVLAQEVRLDSENANGAVGGSSTVACEGGVGEQGEEDIGRSALDANGAQSTEGDEERDEKEPGTSAGGVSLLSAVMSTASKATAAAASGLTTAKNASTVQRAGVPVDYADGDYVMALQAESSELRKELESVEQDFEKTRKERSKLVKNLKRMKEIVSEMDESLQDKSSEARRLESELIAAKDEIEKIATRARESNAQGKDSLESLRKELQGQIDALQDETRKLRTESESLKDENERLREALQQGHEVDLATADGARQEASQAHLAYEAEACAHRETRRAAKEREEALEAEAAATTTALAAAERKADECMATASTAKAAQRAAEAKLGTVSSARDAAFARLEDVEASLRLYQGEDGAAPPGQEEISSMHDTISELENAMEAKNVELNRLEGEVESLRDAIRSRRESSPRTPTSKIGRPETGNHQEVEQKLRHMADAALRKQAQLEVLRSENKALQHQLDTERKRTREAQAMAAAASSSRQSIRGGFRGILDVGDEERGERAYGLREGPLARFRTPRTWPRPVSRAISALDRVSAKALAFLRKEPLVRMVILVYAVALHIYIYSLLHFHIDAVAGSGVSPHGRVASPHTLLHPDRTN